MISEENPKAGRREMVRVLPLRPSRYEVCERVWLCVGADQRVTWPRGPMDKASGFQVVTRGLRF